MAKKVDRAVKDVEAKRNWLQEHLPYEVKMMRHSLRRINEVPGPWFLDWNAYLASFAVSAGNISAFLTNKDKGQNNFKASNFVISFRSRKTDEVKTPFEKMEPDVFHLGKYRPTDQEQNNKFGLADAKLVADWIEQELANFIGQLSARDRALWDEAGSVPPEPPTGARVMGSGLEPQSSSSHSSSVSLQGYTGYRQPDADKSD